MIRDMKGIEKLEFAKVYNVTTQFGQVIKCIAFEGFEQENDDVTLAVFSDPATDDWFYFDISIPGTEVEFN
jgi:hypothetical protein